MYDINANAGTTENTILLFNLPFPLSNDAKQSSDNALKYNFGFHHQKNIGQNIQIRSNIGFARTDYNKLNTLDLMSLSATS